MDALPKDMDFLIKHWAPYPRRLPANFAVVSTDFMVRKTDRVAHVFTSCNFSLILRGGGDFVRNGRSWPVVAPCVITQWPGDQLSYGPSGAHTSWDECYVIYRQEEQTRLKAAGLIDPERPVWPIRNLLAVQAGLRELRQLTRASDPAAAADRVDRVWERVLVETLLAPAETDEDADQIQRVAAKLRAELARPLDMESLAAELGVSVPTFRRRWLEVMGAPPARYLQELRLQEASRMLVETHRPVKQVAREAGFEDELYFSRRFHARTGLSPSEYRRTFRLNLANA